MGTKKTRERYKIVSIVLFVLMGFILSGCSRKEIPEGISEEVYEKGVKTSELVHDVLDGKTNLDEFANQFDDISKELVDIIQKEYDDGSLDTDYYLDQETSEMILNTAIELMTVNGDAELKLKALDEILKI